VRELEVTGFLGLGILMLLCAKAGWEHGAVILSNQDSKEQHMQGLGVYSSHEQFSYGIITSTTNSMLLLLPCLHLVLICISSTQV